MTTADRSPLTIIAVHGNGGGAMRFELTAPHAPPGIAWRSVTLPGFEGTADRPELTTMAAYGAVLAEQVAEIIAGQGDAHAPAVVLGHGIGGSIALAMLQQQPDIVDGLILHAPVGARLDTRLFPRIMSIRGAKPVARRLIASRLLRPMWRRLFFDAPLDRAYLDRFFDEYRRCAPFARMFDIITAPWFDSLDPVRVPTVLLWGSGDRVLDADQMHAFRRVAPSARHEIVEGWDHFPMIEDPRGYAERIATIAGGLVGR